MQYVTTDRGVEEVAQRVGGEGALAVDTEAAGYHRYFDRVCLVQISTPSATFVIDTLAVDRLEPLRSVFEGPTPEVVFHDADYDLRLLSRDFGIHVRGLFDTKVAAQFLGEPSIGLASLVEKYLGMRLAKAFQRADWAQRPLPAEMLEYAAEDTRHLLPLRDLLRAELERRGRMAWAEEEFRILEDVRWTTAAADPDAYLRLKGTRDLRPRQLAILRELYAWREEVARERDAAPFRVLTNEAMVEIARRAPETTNALAAVPGTPRSLASRHGREVLAAIERARALPEEALPTRPRGAGRPPPDPVFDATLERLRTIRDEVATSLGIDRGFLMPRGQLEELARLRPGSVEELAEVPGLRRWQVEALGKKIVRAIAG